MLMRAEQHWLLQLGLLLVAVLFFGSGSAAAELKPGTPKVEMKNNQLHITVPMGKTPQKKPETRSETPSKKPTSGSVSMKSGKEKVSGLNLMVAAYLLIWFIIFGYMIYLRRIFSRQQLELSELNERLKSLAEKT